MENMWRYLTSWRLSRSLEVVRNLYLQCSLRRCHTGTTLRWVLLTRIPFSRHKWRKTSNYLVKPSAKNTRVAFNITWARTFRWFTRKPQSSYSSREQRGQAIWNWPKLKHFKNRRKEKDLSAKICRMANALQLKMRHLEDSETKPQDFIANQSRRCLEISL